MALSFTTAVLTLFIIILIPGLFSVWGIVKWLLRVRKIGKKVDMIEGPARHPITGNITQIPPPSEKMLQYNVDMTTKYKTHFSFWFGPFRPVIVVCHPSTVKQIMKTAEPKQLSGKGGYSLILDWLGHGLLMAKGASWFRNRRLLTPAFHFDVLKPYMRVYNEATDIFMENISKANHSENGAPVSVEVFELVGLCTLNVMLKCAFSYDEDVQRKGENHPYVRTVNNLSKLIVQRAFNILMYPDAIYYRSSAGKEWLEGCDFTHQVAYNLIHKRRQILETGGAKHTSKRALDFLDILLMARDESGEGLTDLEIRQEVDTFLFEGHDTTASGLTWCLYNLSAHPEFQDLARKEVDELLEGRDEDYLQWEDMNKLPYLTMCIKESLRHTPPVPFIGRELENPMEMDGIQLEPGTLIDINIWGVHHNPLVWGVDHHEYKPDRFHHDNMKDMDSHAFVPFSAGPRNCIGQNFAMNEMKTFMARVLHRYTLRVDPDKVPERRPEIVMRSTDGVHIFMTER